MIRKMRRSHSLSALLIAAVLSLSPAARAEDGFYLKSSDVDLVHILPPPPVPGSPVGQADLAAVRSTVSARTDAEIAQAQADDLRSVFRFADVMGPNFRAENLPLTAQLFEHVYRDGSAAAVAVKAHFQRQRPFVIDPDIKIIVEQAPDFSYPSSHSTFGYEAGILLADMVPEKSAALFDRAGVYAHNRIIAGVHFPTDVEGGRITGSVIANTLLHDAHFLADFDRAKSEVRTALGLAASTGQ